MNKEYEELIESSNRHFNAVYGYIEKHGSTELLQVALQGKLNFIKKVAEDNRIEISN